MKLNNLTNEIKEKLLEGGVVGLAPFSSHVRHLVRTAWKSVTFINISAQFKHSHYVTFKKNNTANAQAGGPEQTLRRLSLFWTNCQNSMWWNP